jgi:peptide/nickel transport system permease protein
MRTRIGLALVLLTALLGAAGPLLPGPDPAAQDLLQTLAAPSWAHPLGTDDLGRDVLARLLHGAPRSLGLAVVCVAFASIGGGLIGLISAYAGGWTDTVLMRLADLMLAFPGILLALLLAGFMGGGIIPMLIGIKVALWPQFARMTRAAALGTLAQPHVEAAELAGFRPATILRRHVLPTVLPQAMTLATLGVGSAIMSISALGFLGLGIQPPVPEWGAMLNETLPYFAEAPVQVAAPCVAIFLAVLGLTLTGEDIARRAARTARV